MYLSLPRFWNADWTSLVAQCVTMGFVVTTFIALLSQSMGYPLLTPEAELAAVSDNAPPNLVALKDSPLSVIGVRQRGLLNPNGQRQAATADIASHLMQARSYEDAPQ